MDEEALEEPRGELRPQESPLRWPCPFGNRPRALRAPEAALGQDPGSAELGCPGQLALVPALGAPGSLGPLVETGRGSREHVSLLAVGTPCSLGLPGRGQEGTLGLPDPEQTLPRRLEETGTHDPRIPEPTAQHQCMCGRQLRGHLLAGEAPLTPKQLAQAVVPA